MYEWTPLHLASWTGKDKVAEALLDHPATRAKVNARNDVGWTPLHLASQKGYLDVVEVLLDHRADVDTREVDGETALHLAAYYGHHEVAKVLLKTGANRFIKNKEGKTPFDLATKEGHTTLKELSTWSQRDPQSGLWNYEVEFFRDPGVFNTETNETERHIITPLSGDHDNQRMSHKLQLACKSCGRSYGRIQELRRHERDKHSPARQCQFCAVKWTRPEKIRLHLIASHRKEISLTVLLEMEMDTLRGQHLVDFLNRHSLIKIDAMEARVQSTSSPSLFPILA
ncbi:ankyrin repeat-containing domain protein [Russula dissimulans]|nr:ankyrin repeat-containing domain protein [Russula dissimulans]